MLEIDGSLGEGGGQVIRTSLALSSLTKTPVKIKKVRAGRAKPGLQRQHLAAVLAIAEIARAKTRGAEIGSRELVFEPGEVTPGDYSFRIGSAGSATLVLQTILPALLHASGPSTVSIEGGTHNPLAPSFPFLERVFVPLLGKLGGKLELTLDRPGFYPRGGGRIRARVEPSQLGHLELLERGDLVSKRVAASVAALPRSIAEREVATALKALDWDESAGEVVELDDAFGPGNVMTIELGFTHATELVTGFGEKGTRSEEVARRASTEALAYLESGVPVGEHLADQLLLLLALGKGGCFRTLPPTLHTTTHAQVLELFLPVKTELRELSPRVWEISVGRDETSDDGSGCVSGDSASERPHPSS